MESNACVQFLIQSTLSAEKDVHEQRGRNRAAAETLEQSQSLLLVRNETVLLAKERAFHAAACLAKLQVEAQTAREEEVSVRARLQKEIEHTRGCIA